MNMTYIRQLEQTKGRDLSVYELSQLMQHRLHFSIVNFSVKEAQQLIDTLEQHKKEVCERNGGVFESTLAVSHDRRSEVLMAECALANTSGDTTNELASKTTKDYQ